MLRGPHDVQRRRAIVQLDLGKFQIYIVSSTQRHAQPVERGIIHPGKGIFGLMLAGLFPVLELNVVPNQPQQFRVCEYAR